MSRSFFCRLRQNTQHHCGVVAATAPIASLACYPVFVTKIELHYELVRPLSDDDAKGVADVHSWYGIVRVRVAPDVRSVDVEYDASRLTEKDVEAVLVRFGIPIQRKWSL